MFELFQTNQLPVWFERLSFKNEDPYNVLQYFRSSSNEYLIGGKFSDLDELYRGLDSNTLISQKHELYLKIEDFLIHNFLALPILDIDTYLIHKKNMTTPKISGNNYYINNWHEIGIVVD
jgi:hypothetical protein